MKLAIVGYGKMGKIVESSALDRGHEIVAIIDSVKETTQKELQDTEFDIIIEFASSRSVRENLKFYAEQNYKVIMGTTGWGEHQEEIQQLYQDSQAALLWSGNFSLGVQIFYQMIEYISTLLNQYDEYDISAHEWHHTLKTDSPSGTLMQIGDILLNRLDRKTEIQTAPIQGRCIGEHELHLTSSRGGHIPGTHQITCDSVFDSIELKHTARTREGFAIGSLMCAEWLQNKHGYFEISDFTQDIVPKFRNETQFLYT